MSIRSLSLAFAVMLCFVCRFPAQTDDRKYIDSMELAIKKVRDPYKKARKILMFSDYYSYRDTAMAFRKIEEAEKLMKGNQSIEGLVLVCRANTIYDTDIERSQKLYMKAEELLKGISNQPLVYDDRAILWHNYAALEQLKGNDKEFVRIIIQKCIPLVQKSKNNDLMAGYYVDLGMTFSNIKEYKKSEEYFKLSLETMNRMKSDKYESMIWTFINMSSMYTKSGQLEKAKETFRQLEKLILKFPDSQYSTLHYLYLTQYYIKTGERAKAYSAVEEGLKQAEKLNILYDLESLSFEKYKLLKEDKKYTEAIEALTAILDANIHDNAGNRLNYLKEMSDIQKKTGRYDLALSYLEQYSQLGDSINLEGSKKNIQELEKKYKTAVIEQKLLIAEQKSQFQRIIFIASVLLFLTIAGFGVYAYILKRKEMEKELVILEQKKNLEVSEAVITGEEHERKRIAKELHDGISGSLTGIKLHLENIDGRHSEETVSEITGKLENVMQEIRQISRNLMPETLLDSGLDTVLKEFCNNMNFNEIKVSYYSSDLFVIQNKITELNILRIVQELVTNAVRHGEAKNIFVQVTFEKPVLMITVEDDGKGFDFEKVRKSLGIANVANRVKSLNGTVHWDTAPEKGTNVNIECVM